MLWLPAHPLARLYTQVVNLSLDPEAATSRLMHWNSEVLELQRKVYPLLAQQQQLEQ